METLWRPLVIAAMAGLALAAPARAQTKVVVGLSDPTVSMAWAYIALPMGFWKEQGLDVETPVIEGPAGAQAVLAGDAQFDANNAATSLVITIHHQPLIQVASTQATFNNAIVLSREAAARTGVPLAGSSFEQRARALKGMTLAAGQANNILDTYLRHVVGLVGLDPEKDLTRTFIDSTSALPAMAAGRIDGFSGVPPWPQVAEARGTGVIWINGARGEVPDLKTAAATGISTRADYCDKHPEICRKFLAGVKKAVAFLNAEPAKSLELVAANLKNQDPAVLKASFELMRASITPGLAYTEEMYQATQRFDIGAGLIKPQEALTRFDGLAYTNAYLN